MYPLILLVFAIGFIVLAGSRLRMHPFLVLLLAAFFYGAASGVGVLETLEVIAGGFGNTLGRIGLIIVLGMLIGAFLEHSGGATAMAFWVLELIGPRAINWAMAAVGYIVSVPVFCDSGFVILNSLMKGMAIRGGIPVTGPAVALAMGLLATHTMVPPTPGPVAAAAILGANIGTVLLWGLIVSLFSLIITLLVIRPIFKLLPIYAAMDMTDRPNNTGRPSAGHAFLPVLIPIFLIVLGAVSSMPARPLGEGMVYRYLILLGNPVIALVLGFLVALTLPKRFDKSMLSDDGWVGQSLVQAGSILLITGAGGAFGAVLQSSGLGSDLGLLLAGKPLGIWVPFLIAAVLKTAQGSSTVALLTAASIITPSLAALGLDSEVGRALTVIAIGAGSCVVSHANDSYFWVVTQLSGMDLRQGYALVTLSSALLGLFSALLIFFLGMLIL